MWIPAQTTTPPWRTARERGRHELAGRGEDDRGVELLGRALVGASGPGARRGRARTPASRASPGRVNANTERPSATRHLGDDVRGGAEPVQADALAVAGEPQRAEADQPGAQQRRDREVAEASGSGKQKRASATASSA